MNTRRKAATNSSRTAASVRRLVRFFAVVLAIVFSGAYRDAHAQTYNARDEFTLTQGGTTGVWKYGYTANPTNHALILYPNSETFDWCSAGTTYQRWKNNALGITPELGRNPTAAEYNCHGIRWPADALHLHPGPGGERSVLRWTAPAAGTFRLTGFFEGLNSATTDVKILTKAAAAGEAVLFSGDVTGFNSRQSFDLVVTVSAGETADFSVGYGNGGGHSNDSTGLAVTVTRYSTNADLSALTLSSGTLAPTFASGTTSYTAAVSNSTTSVTVTPTAAHPDATIRVNGTPVTSGSASTPVNLSVGENTITTVVTAQDGTTTKIYAVSLTRAASPNANLSNLTLSSGTLTPGFASGTTSYTAAVSNTMTSITVTPTAAEPNATISVNGAEVSSGSASAPITLTFGTNTATIVVTAPDGTTTLTYTVAVTRAASANANLSNLVLSTGTLTPGFSSTTTSYTTGVSNAVTSMTVTPTAADPTATIRVNGTVVTSGSGSGPIALAVGSNTITTLVTAQDGTTTKTYTLTVTRAASANANLSNLVLSTGTLTPAFVSTTTSYTTAVSNATSSVTVTPTAADPTAIIRVNGTVVTSGSGSGPIALAVGSNTVTTSVTAQDGTTTKTYMLTVTRAASANANLSNLALSAGTLTPAFASATTSYTAAVSNATPSLTVTPTAADPAATIRVNGTVVTSGSASGSIALAVGSNTITTLVTAQSGTTKTYTLTVTRAATASANLSSLVLSAGTLTPAFASGTTSYTATVTNGTTSTTVTPTAADPGAAITVNGVTVTSGSASAPINLAVGNNTVSTVVTAQGGATTQTYTVTVTRALGDQTPGTVDSSFASVSSIDNGVVAVVPLTGGKTLIGGNFTTVRGGARNRIARLNADGTLDTAFNPGTGANDWVVSAAVQSDGKVLIGGAFTSYNGTARNRIARLNANGTLDTTFNPGTGPMGQVASVAVQSDGKVLIGGGFNSYNGTWRNRIARLNADGTLDTGFDPGTGPNGDVLSLALQSDGKLLIGGWFTSYNGTARHGILRLNADGTLDATFDLGPGALGHVNAVAVQSDGKVLIGGSFNSYNGTARNCVARLNAGGALDTMFDPGTGTGVNGWVYSIAVQSDGKVLIGGDFYGYNGTARNRIARVNADGTLDTTFDPGAVTGASGWVYAVAVQSDGKVLIGGNFTGFNGLASAFLARLHNNPATEALTVTGSQRIEWLRGGAGPEVEQVSFEHSSNAGTSWTILGSGTRINGGWEKIALSLPPSGSIRARGYTRAGGYNGSSGVVERVINYASSADLSGLALSAGTLTPAFASTTTSYTAAVSNVTSSMTVTPTAADATATIRVNGTVVTSGSASVPIALAVGSNTISTLVTAQDGTTTKTYTVTVTRAASANANLSNLALSAGTITPAFASGTTSYTATVSNGTASATVTPTAADGSATIAVNGAPVASGSASAPIILAVGGNTITTVVTAPDGTTTRTYTVTVTRAASANADLSNLVLSATSLTPSFSAGTASYSATVPHSVNSSTVTPTASAATATITVNGSPVTSGTASGPISISVGSNVITTVVTAPDGTTTKIYTVDVTRASPPALGAVWLSSPASGDWNTAANWSTNVVPNGATAMAFFQGSSQPAISLSADTEVDSITFDSGASPFTISAPAPRLLNFRGVGIINNSAATQIFRTFADATSRSQISFYGLSTAGQRTLFENNGRNSANPAISAGRTNFYDSASAGSATFVTNPGTVQDAPGGRVLFENNATAAFGTFTINGAIAPGSFNSGVSFQSASTAGNALFNVNGSAISGNFVNGFVQFGGSASAGNAILNANGGTAAGGVGGGVNFFGSSTAGNASITASGGTAGGQGGSILFGESSSGGASRITLNGNSSLSIANDHTAASLTIGSLAGNGGTISLGGKRLIIGGAAPARPAPVAADALSDATFAGQIADGETAGGSLEKIGPGSLILTGANSYTGGTVISGGELIAGRDGALGDGSVRVAAQAQLTLQGGATNQYLGREATLTLVTGSQVNLNFGGTLAPFGTLVVNGVTQPPGVYGPPGSGAPNVLSQFTGSGTVQATLPTARSRKSHGGAGSFDINLPLTGTPAVECRNAGANGIHQIIVQFPSAVAIDSAAVTAGTGTVAAASVNGAEVTIDLSGVANLQTLTVTLFNANDGVNVGDVAIPVAFLVGDTNGDRTVNSGDAQQTRSRSGQTLSSSNFRADVNVDGNLNSGDAFVVKARSGNAIP